MTSGPACCVEDGSEMGMPIVGGRKSNMFVVGLVRQSVLLDRDVVC